MSNISNMFKRLLKSGNKKFHILTFADHTNDIDYKSPIYKTDNNFFIINNVDLEDDDKDRIPKQCFLLPKGMLMHSLSYDFILANNRLGNDILSAKDLSNRMSLPLIVFTEKKPPPELKPKYLQALRKHAGDLNIFLTQDIKNAWNIQGGVSIALDRPLNIKDIQNVLNLVSEGIYS